MTELHCSYCDRILENPHKRQITSKNKGLNVFCISNECKRKFYYYKNNKKQKKITKNCLICKKPFCDSPRVLCCSDKCKKEREIQLKRKRNSQKRVEAYKLTAAIKRTAEKIAQKKINLKKVKKQKKIIKQNRKFLKQAITDKSSPLRHENQWIKVSNKGYDEAFLNIQKTDPDEYIKKNWVM